ncbi:ROK family protein, partial [Actinoplanes sp. NPDC024001]|uniref:ROK family protein n=1 Tax=Actinoplanes sp. NPDC024001 TaxID=3154598 RepID=UPI00340FAD7F
MTGLVAGVDIGGTKIAVGAVGPDGAVHAQATAPTPAREGADAVLSTVRQLISGLGRPVEAIGVGSAGVIDAASGTVRSATEAISGWAGTDLAGRLGSAFGVPVAVDNDVHAHALGEAWLGAAAGRTNVLYMAAGTG